MLLIWLMFPFVCCANWSPAPEGGLDGRLLQIHVVYSHGHISPKAFYAKDPHASSPIWNNGPLELTVLGRQQGFQLGKQLRSRYGTLLSKARAWETIEATSSYTSRTLTTSTALLAGLVSTANGTRSDIAWQPITVHTSTECSRALASNLHCPQYDYLKRRQNSDNDDDTRMLYRLLTKYTGEPIETSDALLNLYRCLEIERQAGLRIPKWTRPIYRTMMRHVVSTLRHSTETLKLKRLRSGPLINILTKYKNDSRDVHLYCTDDTVLGSLMDSFGFKIAEPPSFASAFVIEYREWSGVIHTQMWYSQGHESEPAKLQVPGCDIRCPWDKLKKQLKPLIPSDWTEECVIVKYERDVQSELRCVLAFVLVIVLLLGYFIKKYSRKAYLEL